MSNKIILGVGGSSGALYAKLLMDKLKTLDDQWDKVGVVMSDNAKLNWKIELENEDYKGYPFDFYEKMDFFAPFASGSAKYNIMIVCPCSMGLLARMAQGISNDLLTRSADVILKERRKLIVVPREMPYSLIHIENLKLLTLAGAIVCPASPSFYSKPQSIEALAATVVDRVIDLAGLDAQSYRWGE